MSIRRLLLIILVVLIVYQPNIGLASSTQDLKFDKLYVSLWVEFDKPEKWNPNDPNVLLMYNGSVKNISTSDYTGRIGFNIPANPDTLMVNMVCETENGMRCQPYKIDKTDQGAYISWQPTRPIKPGESFPFMVEVYYNPIVGNVDKTIDFTFKPTYDIDELSFDIKAPLKATNFNIEPAPQQTVSEEGFNYYIYTATNFNQQDTKAFKISYQKEGAEPSVAAPTTPVQTTSSQQVGAQSPTRGKTNWGVLAAIIALSAMLIGLISLQILKNKRVQAEEYSADEYEDTEPVVRKQAKKNKKKKAENSELVMARKLLLEGKISEATYNELIKEIEG